MATLVDLYLHKVRSLTFLHSPQQQAASSYHNRFHLSTSSSITSIPFCIRTPTNASLSRTSSVNHLPRPHNTSEPSESPIFSPISHVTPTRYAYSFLVKTSRVIINIVYSRLISQIVTYSGTIFALSPRGPFRSLSSPPLSNRLSIYFSNSEHESGGIGTDVCVCVCAQ